MLVIFKKEGFYFISIYGPYTFSAESINTYTLKTEFKCHKTCKCRDQAKEAFCPEIPDINVDAEEYLKSQLHCAIELCQSYKCQDQNR